MKIFSSKKPVSFRDGHIVVEDLAYNHPYKKVGKQLVIEGRDEQSKWDYQVFYSLKGELQLVVLKKHTHSVILTCFKDEYDNYEVQKIKPNGDTFVITSSYQTTSCFTHKLVGKSFLLQLNGQEQSKKFTLQNRSWISENQISQDFRQSWLND